MLIGTGNIRLLQLKPSRYTLLIPFKFAPTVAEFENALLRRWINDLAYLTVEAGALTTKTVHVLMHHFVTAEKFLAWYRNTDPSVNGHITGAEQWLLQYFRDNRIRLLTDQQAFGLGVTFPPKPKP